MNPRPAVFLDRDGTLNFQTIREGRPFPPVTLREFQLFDDVPAGCHALKAAGFLLVVATNQPDVGRGTQSREVVELMHHELLRLVPALDRIEVCYDPGRGEPSRRRKPEPGMIHDAAAALGIDLSRSWMIGDRWRDIDCGHRAGLRTILIDFSYDEPMPVQPDHRVTNFASAVRIVLARARS